MCRWVWFQNLKFENQLPKINSIEFSLLFSERPTSVKFDKFQKGDIITFTEGISRSITCLATESNPAATIAIRVGDKPQQNVQQISHVGTTNLFQKFITKREIIKFAFTSRIELEIFVKTCLETFLRTISRGFYFVQNCLQQKIRRYVDIHILSLICTSQNLNDREN